MKKFLFLAFSLVMFCVTARAADDVGMSYTPTSMQINVPDLIAPVMPVVTIQSADVQTAPVVMFVMQKCFVTSQMASQVFGCANIDRRNRKDFTPPNYGRSKVKYRGLNHYRDYSYNFKH